MGRKRRYYKRKDNLDLPLQVGGFLVLAIFYMDNAKEVNNLLYLTLLVLMIVAAAYIGFKIRGILKLKNSGIREIDFMKCVEFENYLKYYFKDQGYKVKLTPATGDYGADLIIEKDGQKIAIQAKRYRDPVNLKAVQEVIGAIAHYGCSGGMVVTNSVFQKSAWELARTNNITLWDRKTLINKLAEYQKQKKKAISIN